ncbi:T9SS type A sorting domain-containing protein [Spirosoma sp. 209]|uniref:T9SS type A sorting domain-containing protein n=1 Tax=Spirosoma sp. 209 TaxID=1955701 RepID=UPI00098CFE30|nr:T9SS type A sorting domain-containing protein [Spirosoma sp. 209]
MKTLIASLALALSLTVASVAPASANPITRPARSASVASYQSGVYTTAEGKVQIGLDKQPGGKVSIRLVNSQGQEVYQEQVGKRQQQVRLRLDVSGLPDGSYTLLISNGVETTTHALTIATAQPSESTRRIAMN